MTFDQLSAKTALPGPRGLPLIGNLHQLSLSKLHSQLEAWADVYGGIYRFNLAGKRIVAISDIELIQHILRDRPAGYRRSKPIEEVTQRLGMHGVFAAEGEQWQRHRALTMQAFRIDNLRRFFPTLHLITERLHRRWLGMAGRPADMRREWMRYTIDVTTRFAFGYDIDLIEHENAAFQDHLERQLPGINRWANAPLPYWRYFKLPVDRRMEKSLASLKDTIAGFVNDTRARLAEQASNHPQPANFLETLLLAKDENGGGLSPEEIQGNILTILLAGEDTTGHTLSWLVYLLAEHPEIERRVRQEADAVLGGLSLPPDFETLDRLPYIEAVAQETLRLKNVAPMLYIEPIDDVRLNGFAVAKGTPLILLTRHAALQDRHFGQAAAFRPERWLSADAACPHQRNAFIPFGAGPRFCPGRTLAMLEIKMAVAMLYRNFDIARLDSREPVREFFSFTMLPENLRVKIAPR